ncbi:MAG: aromatic ring-hydroxylating dioxygenase subunit alpha [Cytophagales bacterium]|nr:aromatic ring-hydroxylating dioxygenase subunit alpha [Cytophagales bacterium]
MDILKLINSQKQKFPLEQPFYVNKKIFELDLKTFFYNQWVFVGHASRIPNKGDYFLFSIGNESIIIIRENNEKINCFFNVCRHRGSHICLEDEGRVRKLICPYHAWGYDLGGNLINAKMMEKNFNPKDWNLKKCYSQVFEGLVFINLSEKPSEFKNFIKPIKPFIELHGLGRAKIADRKIYPTKGNWKLALDNFHECYHCQPSHPEYCHVHSRDYIQSYGAGSNTGPKSKEFNKKLKIWNKKVKKLGYLTGEFSEDKFSEFFRSAERTPFSNGKLSETKSGKPASTLMGEFNEFDGGYTTIGPSPFNSIIMSNDFATTFTFIPKGPNDTDIEIMWLVNENAIEGVDYNIEELTWMWHKTTLEDKRIIEDNQKGVLSKKYEPGPLSEMEMGLEKLKIWYLKHLEKSIKKTTNTI